uniref:Claudin n=1 Tax=Dicentrarchus labrax TaxID=13489 RepID=A0A8P4K5W6_DICLA
MWRRLAQILGLLLCILGWGFVGCTLAMDHWRVAQLGGQGGSSVVVTAWYWSDLWKDCYEDSTALVNCVDFGVLWSVKSHIQAVRGLLIFGLCVGLVATVLTFFGLECTHIGGDQGSNDRMLITASALHLVGCECDSLAFTEPQQLLRTFPHWFVSFCFSMCHRLSLMQACQTWLLTAYT